MKSRRIKPFRLAAAFSAALILITAGSCSVSQDVLLDRQGRGTAEINITLKPVLVRYFTDLLEFSGNGEIDSIFNETAIREAFRTIPDLALLDMEILAKGKLYLSVAFSDAEKAFFSQVGTEVAPAVEVNRRDEGWKANLYLDTDNYGEIVDRMLILTGMVMFEDYLTGALRTRAEGSHC